MWGETTRVEKRCETTRGKRLGGKRLGDETSCYRYNYDFAFKRVTRQLVPKSTRTLVNSYLFLVNSYLSQFVPKSTRTSVFLYLFRVSFIGPQFYLACMLFIISVVF